jgi:hypothetical protein
LPVPIQAGAHRITKLLCLLIQKVSALWWIREKELDI